MKKIRPLYIFIVFLLIFITFELTYTRFIFSAERSADIMGTPVRVKVNGPASPRLARRALWEIKRLDEIFSTFKPQSEVSLINRLAGQAPLQVSSDTFAILKQAVALSKLTEGAFDVTLGNPQDLGLDPKLRKVYLRRAGVRIDLGGIGKGYAVESARRLLLKKGARAGMIDMRSSIAVFGSETWRVGIQHPRDRDKLMGIVELRDGDALSTSGDYERGKHIIDPKTGKLAEGVQSVTIVEKDATEADALTTAVFVLGPKRGMELIESLPGIEGMIVDAEGKVIKSSGFVLLKEIDA